MIIFLLICKGKFSKVTKNVIQEVGVYIYAGRSTSKVCLYSSSLLFLYYCISIIIIIIIIVIIIIIIIDITVHSVTFLRVISYSNP